MQLGDVIELTDGNFRSALRKVQPGTKLVGPSGKVRVRSGGAFLFEDKDSYETGKNVVVFIPEKATERDELAFALYKAGNEITASVHKDAQDFVKSQDDPAVKRHRRMADYVLRNYFSQAAENPSKLIAIIDNDGDRWEPDHGDQWMCVTTTLNNRTRDAIVEHFGARDFVYA